MQGKKNKPGKQNLSSPDKIIPEVSGEVTGHMEAVEKEILPIDPSKSLEEQVEQNPTGAIFLEEPPFKVLNGSQRLMLWKEREGIIKDKKSSLLIAKNPIDRNARETSPIESDAMWFVVDYDRDLNILYKKDKLKMLGIYDEHNAKYQKRIQELANNGDLDIVKLGDRVFMNNENFIPVKVKFGFNVYYVVHYMDILSIYKQFDGKRGMRD